MRAQQAGGSAYAIGGIEVDVSAPTPEAARLAAFRIAQRRAWPLLWSRLTGGAVSAAPRLTDGQLDSIVSGIESQGERFSTTRYIARLGVVFDRARTADYFVGSGGTLQSPPMLLMPLWVDGGTRVLYQAKTPWRAAWARFRENVTPIDYITAQGSLGDNIVLTGWQINRPERASWRNILNRFDAVDVLVAEARLVRRWPGGPVTAQFIARHGPDATELGRFSLTTASEDGIDAMLDAAVRQIDEIYALALRDGRLRSEVDLSVDIAPLINTDALIGTALSGEGEGGVAVGSASISAVTSTPDAASASELERQLRSVPGITAVNITSLSLGGTSQLGITYTGAYDALLYALDSTALRLDNQAGQIVLRRRMPADVAVPAPAPSLPPPAAPEKLPADIPTAPPAEPIRRARPDPAPPPVAGKAPANLLPNPQT